MSLFIEVDSREKNCKVIINLDTIAEIAPLAAGGCALFFSDSAGSGSKSSMTVTNDYSQFQQFVMQTVSAEDIAKRFPKVSAPTADDTEDKPKQSKVPKVSE
jgi:hypothetical protein